MAATTNAFSILKVVTKYGATGASFSKIVTETKLPKASAHRLIKELTTIGALSFNEKSRVYQGGMLLAHLGGAVTATFDLAVLARSKLKALEAETGYVATLGMINGTEGVYLDKVEPVGFGLKLHSEIGRSFPLHCTGMGKVLLAFGTQAERDAITENALTKYTANTITTLVDLEAELEQVKKQGYGIDAEEITAGLTCIAAPIFDLGGSLIGAMSCTFPSSLQNAAGKRRVAATVQKHAAAVTNAS